MAQSFSVTARSNNQVSTPAKYQSKKPLSTGCSGVPSNITLSRNRSACTGPRGSAA